MGQILAFEFYENGIFCIAGKGCFSSIHFFVSLNIEVVQNSSFFGVSDCKIGGKTGVLEGSQIFEIWILLKNIVSLYYRKGEPLGFPFF